FALARDAQQISVLDVMEAVEEPAGINPDDLVLLKNPSGNRFESIVSIAYNLARERLSRYTLAMLSGETYEPDSIPSRRIVFHFGNGPFEGHTTRSDDLECDADSAQKYWSITNAGEVGHHFNTIGQSAVARYRVVSKHETADEVRMECRLSPE